MKMSKLLSIFYLDDTGYSSFNSSTSIFDKDNNENVHHSTKATVNERKVCRFESFNICFLMCYLFVSSHDEN